MKATTVWRRLMSDFFILFAGEKSWSVPVFVVSKFRYNKNRDGPRFLPGKQDKKIRHESSPHCRRLHRRARRADRGARVRALPGGAPLRRQGAALFGRVRTPARAVAARAPPPPGGPPRDSP